MGPFADAESLREILSTEAGLIRDFLVETGQVTRDDMLKKKKKKKHRPEDATESVFSEDESESLAVSASTPPASQNRAASSLVSEAMLDLIH